MTSSLLRPGGVDLFCLGKKFLVYNLVSRNLKIKYRRSILGLFWTLVSPMATGAIFYFVFKVILAVRTPHYLVFILVGVLFWNSFAQTLSDGMESIVGNLGLVSKVPIPLQIFPYTGAITNLVALLISLPVILGAALLTDTPVRPAFVFVFFYAGCLFLMSYGLSHLLAVGFVMFRDLRHLLGIGLQIWFYATPVVYGADMVPEKYAWILYVNPLGAAFVGLREATVQGRLPSVSGMVITLGWSVLALAAAVLCQRSAGAGLVERI